MNRRDIMIGAACALALGGAEWLRPRNYIKLLGDNRLSDITPLKFGAWEASEGGDIVIPETPGSLMDQLYNDTLARSYANSGNGMVIMLLIAYGEAQSDMLQLHRPESCYPAIGFEITSRTFPNLQLGDTVPPIPAVALTAKAGQRVEDIVYWTRLGERLPRTSGEQRKDKLATAMQGYVGDGALIRASALRPAGAEPVHDEISAFLESLITAMPAKDRKAYIGTERAADFGTP